MKVTLIAGSNREQASSTRLTRYLAKLLDEQGFETEVFSLYEHQLPLYGPGEAYGHEEVLKLSRAVKSAGAVVLSTPEYHSSISGVLKNALDFLNSEYFEGKPVLCASSAGGAVGVSSLGDLQAIVRNLHGLNCPEWISIGGDQRHFGENGEPLDQATELRIRKAVDTFVHLIRRIYG
ncbi:NADPH-dependent FMN reductase [Saccharibacillus sp. CPCC 101409]|uniref:NADPH-dependent FMN reductase n=1 Tax=Saccharibacillus sp. CPCC 101409 TaxID=3058041 RepID=UPI00267248D8|nr:NADPH-dependent FMN reductase [Saccharibacillus sp. CPCC 101409]MDO3409499.1 NADPH-dependent FMN reductase [Saccharibacillus sp. CPCC 101409]